MLTDREIHLEAHVELKRDLKLSQVNEIRMELIESFMVSSISAMSPSSLNLIPATRKTHS